MKLYTKTGDAGETSLYGGKRRPKNDLRVTAYGEVDELQAVLGLAIAHCQADGLDDLLGVLQSIQNDGFILCSQLARGENVQNKENEPVLSAGRVVWLESQIDSYETQVPPLRAFIVQGGSLSGAHLHLGRAVCRRAERAVVALSQKEAVDSLSSIYLNRLSDLLFVMARVANHRLGKAEVQWKWHK